MKHNNYKLNSTGNQRWLKLSLFAVIFVILVSLLAYVVIEFRKINNNYTAQMSVVDSLSQTAVVKQPYVQITGRYLFSGTVMLGRAVELYAKGDYNQPFSGMVSLGSYDARIGVLECPITSNVVSYQTQVDKLKFNCSPNWLPKLKEYFPIVNVSSNHLYDMGMDGFDETVKRLKEAGFQVVGNYNPHIESDNCKVVILPVHLTKSSGVADSSNLPLVLCSFNYKSLFSPNPGELESIQKWSKIMPVIGLMNGGPEYQHMAGASQTVVAHQMIDYGADFVVGNGTHWVQNTEVYKGKLIEYSMGNFIFDQLDYDGRIALNLGVTMSITYDANAAKWLAIAKSCVPVTDSCRDKVTKIDAQKLQPKFDFDIVGSYGGSGKVATLANTQQQNDIEKLANWSITHEKLLNEAN